MSRHYSQYDPLSAQMAQMTMSGPGVVNFRQDQDYNQIVQYHRQCGQLFTDHAFPASNALLDDFDGRRSSSRHHRRNIEWLRPHDICKRLRCGKEPQMFVLNTTHRSATMQNKYVDRFDINQGELGNCWFLAALATLAENERVFTNVVPEPMSQTFDFRAGYCGVFRFRFFRFGHWVEVVIDDLLPTRGGELVFLKSNDKNEFWSALLEKAYAKLHGSYKALEGGLTLEAAVDFTGGIPEMIDLTEIDRMKRAGIFHAMVMASNRDAFLGCAINARKAGEASRMGLQSRHAYTITKAKEINVCGRPVQLVRIRNPHGNNREWNGAWSDRDATNWNMVSPQDKFELLPESRSDGEFCMTFRDFLEYFGDLEMCHLTADDSGKRFQASEFRGCWQLGVSDGGCGNDGFHSYAKNPQFFIDLTDPDPYDAEDKCPVIISLAQKQTKRKAELAIGFKLYKCKNSSTTRVDEHYMRKNNSYARSDHFINMREVSKRLHLPPGRYCIIPSTFEPGKAGEFILRVFIEQNWANASSGGGGGQAYGQQQQQYSQQQYPQQHYPQHQPPVDPYQQSYQRYRKS